MGRRLLTESIERLREQFPTLQWTYHDLPFGGAKEKMYRWPGPPDEDILVLVHKSDAKQELFHRHDFFYFNYTSSGQYDSLSYKYDNRITIRESELYAGQLFAGHGLCVHDNQETVIIGVLIKRDTFFRAFLPMICANSKLFRFFLDPMTDCFSDEFIHFKLEEDCNIRILLEMMVIEYAHKKEDTQEVLKSLALAFLVQITRQYAQSSATPAPEKPSDQIVRYISEHFDTASLSAVAKRFSYHPNYISSLLRQETGKTFTELLLEQRMERAVTLLGGTELPVAEIAAMLGYGNASNFFKAFRAYYHMSPREYLRTRGTG